MIRYKHRSRDGRHQLVPCATSKPMFRHTHLMSKECSLDYNSYLTYAHICLPLQMGDKKPKPCAPAAAGASVREHRVMRVYSLRHEMLLCSANIGWVPPRCLPSSDDLLCRVHQELMSAATSLGANEVCSHSLLLLI